MLLLQKHFKSDASIIVVGLTCALITIPTIHTFTRTIVLDSTTIIAGEAAFYSRGSMKEGNYDKYVGHSNRTSMKPC